MSKKSHNSGRLPQETDRIKYCSLSYNQISTGDLDTSILREEEDTAMKSLMEGKSLGTEIPAKLFGMVERKLSS